MTLWKEQQRTDETLKRAWQLAKAAGEGGKHRRALMKSLRACLVKLKDPRGKALLATAKAPWKAEAPLVAEADAGIAEM